MQENRKYLQSLPIEGEVLHICQGDGLEDTVALCLVERGELEERQAHFGNYFTFSLGILVGAASLYIGRKLLQRRYQKRENR